MLASGITVHRIYKQEKLNTHTHTHSKNCLLQVHTLIKPLETLAFTGQDALLPHAAKQSPAGHAKLAQHAAKVDVVMRELC